MATPDRLGMEHFRLGMALPNRFGMAPPDRLGMAHM
jgi:hypothetical protein